MTILSDRKKETVIPKAIKFGIRAIAHDAPSHIHTTIPKRIYIDSNSKISNCKDTDRATYQNTVDWELKPLFQYSSHHTRLTLGASLIPNTIQICVTEWARFTWFNKPIKETFINNSWKYMSLDNVITHQLWDEKYICVRRNKFEPGTLWFFHVVNINLPDVWCVAVVVVVFVVKNVVVATSTKQCSFNLL